MIKDNPKIICGYSDPTSVLNIINATTGLVTFHGPNFRTLSDEETDYGYKEVIKRFFDKDLKLGTDEDEFVVIKEGKASRKISSEEIYVCFQI